MKSSDVDNLPELQSELSQPKLYLNSPPRAGFWIRFFAAIMDVFVSTMIYQVLAFLILIPLNAVFREFPEVFNGFIGYEAVIFFSYIVFYIFPFVIYCWLFLSSKWRATPGKRVLGIYVLNENSKPLTFTQVILREFVGKWISNITLCIGYIMVAFRNDKMALHDILAKTHVYVGKAEDHPIK